MIYKMISFLFVIMSALIAKLDAGCHDSKETGKGVETFEQYKVCFNQRFNPSDDKHRKKVFEKNLETIKMLRLIHPKMLFSVNNFSHLTLEEFQRGYLGFKPQGKLNPKYKISHAEFPVVDWREKGVVAPVKNQEMCGSCYAFSAIGAIESQHAIKTKNLVTYSEQQVVDCSWDYDNHGCAGGLMDRTFNYSRDFGLMTDTDYPYLGKDKDCKYKASAVKIKLSGWKDLPSGREDDLTEAIRDIGPISVAIDGSQSTFMFYSGGIYDDSDCSSTEVNHGVVAVGVADDYYILRNSYGNGWGESGYMRLARNHGNRCGIATMASYPIL